jgi:hypothetical protein
MAKVKVVGDVSFEFEVKFNQPVDIEIETRKVVVDGRTFIFGKGNVDQIDEKAWSFITSRMKYFLEKKYNMHKYFYDILSKEDPAIKELSEMDPAFKAFFDASYIKPDGEAIGRMLEEKTFLLTAEGIRKYQARSLLTDILHLL